MSTQTITTRPTLRRAAVAVLAVIFAAAVVRRIRVAAGMRRGDQAVIDAKRARNKRVDKVVTSIGSAGRPHSIFAVIHYTGRRSGRRYSTPIRVVERLKEWVYGGAIFTYTGPLISHLAVGGHVSTLVGPLFLIVLTITSWALRPPSRRVSATS
jgi:hypothetical protein